MSYLQLYVISLVVGQDRRDLWPFVGPFKARALAEDISGPFARLTETKLFDMKAVISMHAFDWAK